MLFTVIKKNSYQDSINLMLLTNRINELEGINRCSIMMATDANKQILEAAGLLMEEGKAAAPNDMVIAADAESESMKNVVLAEVETFLSDLSVAKKANQQKEITSWDEAMDAMPDANVALFSIPGEYAAADLEEALDRGLHVFSFTDNVAMEDEVRLKKKAHEKGLLFMGPDCGTGMISGVPIAFTNMVRPGNIGIVGASGTGIQEVMTQIAKLGGGIVHAIGTGGRDLSSEVGAITMKDAILGLKDHDPTEVIVVVSKPPAKEVRDEVVELLQNVGKPVVAIFLGEKPACHQGNVYLAHTLEETARIAVDLSEGKPIQSLYPIDSSVPEDVQVQTGKIRGLYSGGTLAAEAAMLISEAIDLGGLIKEHGYMLKANGYEVVDLGDDVYTQGKPHPMIDPEVRVRMMEECAEDESVSVILVDCMLGYGCHPNMAGELAKTIIKTKKRAKELGRELYYVATVCGTSYDPQDYEGAIATLKAAGAIVKNSNAAAVMAALSIKGINISEEEKKLSPWNGAKITLPSASEKVVDLLNSRPRIINVGVESFCDSIRKEKGEAVHYAWKPAAGGNKQLIEALAKLKKLEGLEEMNQKVIDRMRDSQPFLVDVIPAKVAMPDLKDHMLLHAGPPIKYEDMTGPMQGSCIGALLFEKWAKDEEEAKSMLEKGEITFTPCHHMGAVGPMGGITSPNMPVMKIINMADGTTGYCIMNEGIGKVLRFGAYSEEVVNRLTWMADTLGPVLSKALKKMDGGMNLSVVIAKAITMGDEFHQRNIAASLIFLKEVTPYIMECDASEKEKDEVIRFLAKTDQFFLNVMMATGKAIVDYARKIKEGCIVTTMSRNGREFGVRIAGMGDEWFTAPVNTPIGLYFTGYTEEDGNPDIGDSAITETVGVGGMAMIAAPGVTRFVGAGGFEDALRISNEMEKICVTHNPNYTIPTWDFKGSLLGIDIRKVVATGITPLINTGIAHKKAGVGQVGAGTVRAPLACFEKALLAYVKKLEEEGKI